MNLFRLLRPALVLFGLLTLITGLGYPLLVTAVAQSVFPWQANGSMITNHGQAVGSELVGQALKEGRLDAHHRVKNRLESFL